MRHFDDAAFDRAFAGLVSERCWQETPEYYRRYRTRYEAIIRRFAELVPEGRLAVLDVGGGQLAYLAATLWEDEGSVADLDGSAFAELRALGLDPVEWNLAQDDPPTTKRFDAVFLSEVLAHLPVPGHVPLRRLRTLLRPGGVLLCSTPNLYRIRNIVYLALGRRLFDHFDEPGVRSYGPIVDYSAEHLDWQLRRAGFVDTDVELRNFPHAPYGRLDRVLYVMGAPIRLIPRYRDHLLAVARGPQQP